MFRVNENYLKLPGSYLFSTIAKKVAAYQKENPDKKLIRLGIGDVTLPIAPAIIDAMHKAVDEMGLVHNRMLSQLNNNSIKVSVHRLRLLPHQFPVVRGL